MTFPINLTKSMENNVMQKMWISSTINKKKESLKSKLKHKTLDGKHKLSSRKCLEKKMFEIQGGLKLKVQNQ